MKEQAVYILCAFFRITAAVGHREGTEGNPGGHGAELCARFPWPPIWKQRRPKTQRGSREVGRVEKGRSLVLGFHGRPIELFLLSKEKEETEKAERSRWMALRRESVFWALNPHVCFALTHATCALINLFYLWEIYQKVLEQFVVLFLVLYFNVLLTVINSIRVFFGELSSASNHQAAPLLVCLFSIKTS